MLAERVRLPETHYVAKIALQLHREFDFNFACATDGGRQKASRRSDRSYRWARAA